MKKHLLISFPGVVTGFLLYYYFATSTGTTNSIFSITEAVSASVCGIFIAYITYVISRKTDTLVPWNTQLASRFLTGILVHFFVAFISIIALYFVYKKIDGSNLPDTYQDAFVKLAIILFIIMLIYNIIYFALYSYYTYSIVQIEAVTYERKQIDLQLKALKSQLSAHFLFNNLNTISSLAFKDAKASEQYIRGLARVYKYALNSYHSKLVFLHEELSML
ncbi:MAG: histidine kinase, partial [Bacteroidota bacterium]